MIYKNIRNNKISSICYGTNTIKLPEHISYIQNAIDCGINFIDTAEGHTNGASEVIIGTAIKDIRKNIFLATKVSPNHLCRHNVLKSCENSLSRLDTDYIDLYYIHWPNSEISLEETCSAFETLIRDGKIKYVGLSNFSYEQIKEAYSILGDKIFAIQSELNPIERSVEKDIIPFCNENNLLFAAYSPLKYIQYIHYEASFILSWLINMQNVIAIVKSLDNMHICENTNILPSTAASVESITHDFIDTRLINYKTTETFSPSQEILASDIKKYGILKPIKLLRQNDEYIVVDGILRLLAWKIAYPKEPIESIILNR